MIIETDVDSLIFCHFATQDSSGEVSAMSLEQDWNIK
jgi:hypothetical protein